MSVIGVVIRVRHVVESRNGGEIGRRVLEIGDIGTVDLELELIGRTENSERGALRLRTRQELHRMVQVQFLRRGAGTDVLLRLRDQHVDLLGREVRALGFVEVDEVGVALPRVRFGGRTPRDAQFHIVVLQPDQGQGVRPGIAEEKPERVKLGVGATEETTETRLGQIRRERLRGDVLSEDRVLIINDLTANQ